MRAHNGIGKGYLIMKKDGDYRPFVVFIFLPSQKVNGLPEDKTGYLVRR